MAVKNSGNNKNLLLNYNITNFHKFVGNKYMIFAIIKYVNRIQC